MTASAVGDPLQRALAAHQRGDLERAQVLYREILRDQPRHVQALHLLGLAGLQAGAPEMAVRLIGEAIGLAPGDAVMHFNRGCAHQQLAHRHAALEDYRVAVARQPDFAQAHMNAGVISHQLEDWPAALASYQRVTALEPHNAEAHFNAGSVYALLESWPAAEVSFTRALALRPLHAATLLGRAQAFAARGALQAALEDLDRALDLDPSAAAAHYNRANVLLEGERLEEALAGYSRAIALRPGYAEAYCNRGLVLSRCNRLPEALADYAVALRLQPHYSQALYNQAFARMLGGDWQAGWPGFELRWAGVRGASHEARRDLPGVRWTGEAPIEGTTLLLFAEQGLGDTLQFCRYAALVAARGARVVLEVQAPLASLLGTVSGVAQVVARGEPLPEYHYWCPLLSLPLVFQTTRENLPRAARYLQADPEKRVLWRVRLADRGTRSAPPPPAIGLVWSGSPHHPELGRSLRLAELLAVLPPGPRYVSLQKDVSEADRLALAHAGILDLSGELHDFSDTAAVCELLDLVVSVDTSVAHLSAALGRPTWILLPFNPDWRWLLARSDSPWYPTATLYRQEARGDWRAPLGRVGADLGVRLSCESV